MQPKVKHIQLRDTQSFSVPEVRLLIVLVPGFGCGVCWPARRSRGAARGARVRTGSDRAGMCSSRVAGVNVPVRRVLAGRRAAASRRGTPPSTASPG